MNVEHDTDGDDSLAGIDLHAWRVPPPPALNRPLLVVSALAPASAPVRRPRLSWLLGAIVLANAVLVALVVVLLARSPTTLPAAPAPAPAGGGSLDPQVRDLMQRLEAEQRELESRLAEVRELRTLVTELSEKLRRYEQQDAKRNHPSPTPAPTPPPTNADACDEVSCVLQNYETACCAKYKRTPAPNALPMSLDRASISSGIASAHGDVRACGTRSSATGTVKVNVEVSPSGRVNRVTVRSTPDAALGACVAAAVQRVTFERTQDGGSFTYPFVFQ